MTFIEIIGQIFSFIAVLFSVLTYQMKSHRQVLAIQTLAVVSMAISYALLGAWTGMLLNAVAIVRNLVYYFHRLFSWKGWPFVMSGLMAVAGVLGWDSPWSLLVIVALVLNSYLLSLPNPNHLRRSILVTSPMVMVYNAVVFSLGGILLEGLSVVSAAIGLVRFRKEKGDY